MIAVDFPEVPVPDRIAQMIGTAIPLHVLQAEIDAEEAAYRVRLSRTVLTRQAREFALAELARHNKVLAAYNPGLVLKSGGVR